MRWVSGLPSPAARWRWQALRLADDGDSCQVLDGYDRLTVPAVLAELGLALTSAGVGPWHGVIGWNSSGNAKST